ncbi:MAG: diguanylate cyclase, partial [Spirochaetales bacterium]
LLYLVPSCDEPRSDIMEYLGIYGYNLDLVKDLAELEGALSSDSRRLVLLDACVMESIKGSQQDLKKIKDKFQDTLSFMFFSQRDDFDTRLAAVRAGGEAFFAFPPDMVRVMDKIDALLHRKEQVPYHILIVDDDPEQVSYNALLLQQAGMITSVALDPRQVVKILVEAKPELILMDMYMPGCDGTELAAIIRQQAAFVGVPIVFLSVESDMEKQIEAIRLGGDDFLMKPIREEHLIASIVNRAERTRSMRYLMERDSLTGLLNHTNLKEQLTRELMRSQRTESEFCFAMIDVDHFKKVNDSYGHLTGDNVLKGLAKLLRERLRVTDIIGRYGGEEFGVVLLNTSLENAWKIMDEIRINFSQIRQLADMQEFFVTFSCGIASCSDFKSTGAINEAADKALYSAKEGGRNKVTVARGK